MTMPSGSRHENLGKKTLEAERWELGPDGALSRRWISKEKTMRWSKIQQLDYKLDNKTTCFILPLFVAGERINKKAIPIRRSSRHNGGIRLAGTVMEQFLWNPEPLQTPAKL